MAQDQNQPQGMQININLDTTPILYTDNVLMTTNEDGMVFDICQKVGPSNQMRIVTRIGMSRSHAKKFLKEMGSLLALTEGKGQTGVQKMSKD